MAKLFFRVLFSSAFFHHNYLQCATLHSIEVKLLEALGENVGTIFLYFHSVIVYKLFILWWGNFKILCVTSYWKYAAKKFTYKMETFSDIETDKLHWCLVTDIWISFLFCLLFKWKPMGRKKTNTKTPLKRNDRVLNTKVLKDFKFCDRITVIDLAMIHLYGSKRFLHHL